MSHIQAVEIAALDRDGCGVRAVFTWQHERYEHSIHAIAEGKSTPLLEGASTPPFQEVVEHSCDDRPALLLTGAGNGLYWSASVTPITDIHFALLGFDMACRAGAAEARPEVEYRLAQGTSVISRETEGSVELLAGARRFLLRAAEMPTSIATEGISTCRLTLRSNGIAIEPLRSPHVSSRGTVQWRYEISAIRAR